MARVSRILSSVEKGTTINPAFEIDLRPWRADDIGLMQRLLGDPAMTVYLGGPETPQQLQTRLDRYLSLGPAAGRMFVITVGPDRVPAGSVGFWPHAVAGEPALETGWSVLLEFQGHGVGTMATARCLRIAAATGGYRTIHAYPAVDNAASNAVCRKLGFELLGQMDYEYPKGSWMTCNDWSLELATLR